MQGMYAVRRVLSVAIFFLTMLIMKEAMDSLLPPPPIRTRGAVHRTKESRLKPGAMLDVEAVAEEEQMGPEIVDGGDNQEQEDDVNGDAAEDEEEEEEEEVKGLVQPPDQFEDDKQKTQEEEEEPGQPEKTEDPEEDGGEEQGQHEEPEDPEEDGGENEDVDAPISKDDEARMPVTSSPHGSLKKTTPSSPLFPQSSKKKTSQKDSTNSVGSFGPNYYTVVIDHKTKMESVQILLRDEIFKFRVKACSDAYVLYKQTKAADEYSYHLGLGYGHKTVIWKQPPDPVTKEFTTPSEGLLKCEEFVSYWVKLAEAKFTIGVEGMVDPFVEWKDPKPFTIGALSLATPDAEQKITWQLDTRSIQTLRVDTGEDYSYEQSWVSVIGHNAIVLQVKSCRDAHVLLSDQDGVPGNGYEVAIGMSENTKTSIRDAKFGPNVFTIDTPDVLSCEETRAFWFLWTHDKLSVGKGTKPGSRIMINYGKVDHPGEIRSLGMSTGWGSTGRWLFNMEESAMYPSTS